MEPNKIPPKSEWKDMSIFQLIDVRDQMMNTYFSMRRISASFAPQYAIFISELDALIARRQAEAEAERESNQD
jgi:hypothetical protein